ncbi:MAG: hypothetical protein KGI58_02125 [Patescibacteria group bacterium]|nr:hypothetical protein [Patescibacteria group bacterium]
MHVNEAKKIAKNLLYNKELKGYDPKTGKGDFRLIIANKDKRFSVLGLTLGFQESMESLCKDFREKLPSGSLIEIKGDSISVVNKSWIFDERKKRTLNSVSGNLSNISDQEDGSYKSDQKVDVPRELLDTVIHKNGNGKLIEPPEKVNEPTEVFNLELVRLNKLGNRLETIMDEFVLKRLSLREMLGQIFDNMKQSNVEFYSTDVQIQIVEGRIVIPNLTRDAFIETGIKSLKKET